MTAQTLASLPKAELRKRLRGEGVGLQLPPFAVRVRSPIPVVAQGLETLYGDYRLVPEDGFADFHVAVVYARRFPRPLCVFEMDGMRPFTPLAAGEAFAFLEWGLNWCVTGYCHTLLAIHSAVLERNGRALLLPAPPGSGKSTLCAALLLAGWRLLSDEMALLDPATGLLHPSPRPVSLKNRSIDIIRERALGAVFGPVARNTLKGTVCHLRVPAESLVRAEEPALPGWVVYPRFQAGAPAQLKARPKGESLMQLAENSFNHNILGRAGFSALAALVEGCHCYDFAYGSLDEAIPLIDSLPPPP